MSLANWQGFGQDFIGLAVERGAGCLYVHQVWKRVPKAAAAAGEGANDASMDTTDDTVSALGACLVDARSCLTVRVHPSLVHLNGEHVKSLVDDVEAGLFEGLSTPPQRS